MHPRWGEPKSTEFWCGNFL